MIVAEPVSKVGILQFDLETIWHAIKILGLPAAIWKIPNQPLVKMIISTNKENIVIDPELEKIETGFVISPFHWKSNQSVNFIQGDILLDYTLSGICQQSSFKIDEGHPVIKQITETALNNPISNVTHEANTSNFKKELNSLGSQERFKKTVALAVTAIKQGKFQKVVLSRTKELSYNDDFQVIIAFRKLVETYDHAFVSLINLSGSTENWLGASPELLIDNSSNGIFKTMSLAGTQAAFDKNQNLIPKHEIRWGQKEIEEHALVSRYIVECFKKIRLREYLETGPKTALAGNLYHLRTDFLVDTKQLNFSELGSVMVKLLHPTSAICGTPHAPALEFIDAVEGYDRSLYSGFLGPVRVEGNTNIYVNLRTVRLKNNIATFYAGAGITEDSIPEKEWEETELKCNTLLKVIASELNQ